EIQPYKTGQNQGHRYSFTPQRHLDFYHEESSCARPPLVPTSSTSECTSNPRLHRHRSRCSVLPRFWTNRLNYTDRDCSCGRCDYVRAHSIFLVRGVYTWRNGDFHRRVGRLYPDVSKSGYQVRHGACVARRSVHLHRRDYRVLCRAGVRALHDNQHASPRSYCDIHCIWRSSDVHFHDILRDSYRIRRVRPIISYHRGRFPCWSQCRCWALQKGLWDRDSSSCGRCVSVGDHL
ncbi:hypothetical protein B0H10DRAFT_2434990, partial [Mycena sp. CBHHK59/15]